MKKGDRLDSVRPLDADGNMVAPEVRTDIAQSARVYDALLGGRSNYPPDRVIADNLRYVMPAATVARRQRRFMRRAAAVAAHQGIDQFLDIGIGFPDEPNLHEVVQAINPAAHVLYIDNDPIVLAHAAALMLGTVEGALHYLRSDAREPVDVLHNVQRHGVLDFDRPIAVTLVGVLHFVPDNAADLLVDTLMKAVCPGSALIATQAVPAADFAGTHGAVGAFRTAGIDVSIRSREQVAGWCRDLDVVDPGITLAHQWRPDEDDTEPDRDLELLGFLALRP